MRTKIYLHGVLASDFGAEHEFHNVSKVKDSLSAMDSRFGNFVDSIKKYHFKGMNYEIVVNEDEIIDTSSAFENKKIKTIHYIPSINGQDVITLLYYIVVAVVAAGVAYLLHPKPEYNVRDIETNISTQSFLFGTNINVTQQGVPVPIGYGRLRVGSLVINSVIRNIDKDTVQTVNVNSPETYNY